MIIPQMKLLIAAIISLPLWLWIYLMCLPNDFNGAGSAYMMQFIVLLCAITVLSPIMTFLGILAILRCRDYKEESSIAMMSTLAASIPGLYLLIGLLVRLFH
jgi:hypothetical protein